MMKTVFSSFLICLTLTTASFAVVLECNITKKDRSGWLPGSLLIDYKSYSGEVIVHDAIIKKFLGGPTDGYVDVDNEKRTTFKWVIDGTTTGRGQFATMNYSATILKGSKKITITGKPLGYLNNYRGTGRCKEK
jgi:hypothetical protein